MEKVGGDWNSDAIWKLYIQFESLQAEETKNFALVFQVYARILSIPLKEMDTFYDQFKTLAISRPASEIISENEIPLSNDMEETVLRQQALALREAQFLSSKAEFSKRLSFESSIKRPYFHVKELSELELQQWNDYLDFEEKESKSNPSIAWRIVSLYERSLIACALYPSQWIRYARFCERAQYGDEYVRAVYARANTTFCKRRPESFLSLAQFEESKGMIQEARTTYNSVLSDISPGLIEAIFELAMFERRNGNPEDVQKVFQDGLETALEKSNCGYAFLVVQYAKYLQNVLKDSSRAKDVLQNSMDKIHSGEYFWIAYASFLSQTAGPDAESEISAAFELALIRKEFSAEERASLWTHYIAFAKCHFSQAETIRDIENRFYTELTDGTSKKKRLITSVYDHVENGSVLKSQRRSYSQGSAGAVM